VRNEKICEKNRINHDIYKEQLLRHDSLEVDPKQLPQLHECPDSVCVPEKSALEVGVPIAESQQNPVITALARKNEKEIPF